MRILTIIFTLIFLVFSKVSNSQSFDRIYQGYWAATSWTFEFKNDGIYTRVSLGHYGNTTVTGTYSMKTDTIRLLSGFDNTHGTVNEFYLLEGDSILIDLKSGYDYKVVSNKGEHFYNSKIRKTKYLHTDSEDKRPKTASDSFLNLKSSSKNGTFTLSDTIFVEGSIYVNKNVEFYNQTDSIHPVSFKTLDSIAIFLLKNSDITAEIWVDVEAVESTEKVYNFGLARTTNVINYFHDKGIAKSKILPRSRMKFKNNQRSACQDASDNCRQLEIKILSIK